MSNLGEVIKERLFIHLNTVIQAAKAAFFIC